LNYRTHEAIVLREVICMTAGAAGNAVRHRRIYRAVWNPTLYPDREGTGCGLKLSLDCNAQRPLDSVECGSAEGLLWQILGGIP